MSHAPAQTPEDANARTGLLGDLTRLMRLLNTLIFIVSSLAIIAAALVLTEGVAARNLFGESSEWQEEVTVFLLLGAMFLSMASVQSRRGHIGIDALTGILPVPVDRIRRLVVDIVSLAFIAFFTWKCSQLLRESVVEDAHTMSTWGPPLWIPYSLMTIGMALLAMQIALQIISGLTAPRKDTHS